MRVSRSVCESMPNVCLCVRERERERKSEAGIALSQTAHSAGGSLFRSGRSDAEMSGAAHTGGSHNSKGTGETGQVLRLSC